MKGSKNPVFKKLNDVEDSWVQAEPNAEKARDIWSCESCAGLWCRGVWMPAEYSEKMHACDCLLQAGLMLVHFAQASGETFFLKSFMCH